MEIRLTLRGMSCSPCASRVEQAIKGVAGVIECNVNFALDQSTICYYPQKTGLKTIQKAVTDAGYGVDPLQEMDNNQDDSAQLSRRNQEKTLTNKL